MVHYGLAATAVIALCLLPKWLGGAQFAVFQGNHWDQISYIAYSAAARSHSLAEIQAATPASSFDLVFAHLKLEDRPSVGLAYGALAALFRTLSPVGSYAYMAMLQSLMFFSAAFVFFNVARRRERLCMGLAAALTVGFFMQYVFDINAWSQLAAMPLALLAMAVLVFTLDQKEEAGESHALGDTLRYTALATVLLTALLYDYPEIMLEYGLPFAVAVGLGVVTARFRPAIFGRGVALMAAGGLAIAACVPFWIATIGHAVAQISVATTISANWWLYFQRYLLGRDIEYATAVHHLGLSLKSAYILFSIPVDFTLSAIGLYFLLPTADVALGTRFLWKLGLAVLSLALMAASIRTILDLWRERAFSRAGRLFAATLMALILPVAFLLFGKFWGAGKALAMAAPLLFFVLAAPLLGLTERRRWWYGLAWVFVLGHLGFGLYRPLAAARTPNGVHYAFPPYPSIQEYTLKDNYDWTLAPWLGVLATCRHPSLDIDNRFLERYLQIYLSELGLDWTSVRPLDSYFGEGIPLGLQPQPARPDCLIATGLDHVQPWQTVIWLGRTHRVWDFYRGLTPDLELATMLDPGVKTEGLYGLEARPDGLLRWTGETAVIEVATNPHMLQAARLDLALWPERSGGPGHDRLEVEVNGVVLFSGSVGDGAWSVSLPLEPVPPAAKLTVRIKSDAALLPGDDRMLGIPLRRLALVRAAD